MARTPAPSMPTEKQVRDAFEVVCILCPGARIKSTGPEGVTYFYPDEVRQSYNVAVQPFSGEAQ
jgi:hypothetical protein